MDVQTAAVVDPRKDPRKIVDTELREIAFQAALVINLEDTLVALRKLGTTMQFGPDEPDYYEEVAREDGSITCEDDICGQIIDLSKLSLWQMIPHDIAMALVSKRATYEEEVLECIAATWLEGDANHWSLFRQLVFDAWQERPGQCQDGTPRWIQRLGRINALTPFDIRVYDPLPPLDYDPITAPDDY